MTYAEERKMIDDAERRGYERARAEIAQTVRNQRFMLVTTAAAPDGRDEREDNYATGWDGAIDHVARVIAAPQDRPAPTRVPTAGIGAHR